MTHLVLLDPQHAFLIGASLPPHTLYDPSACPKQGALCPPPRLDKGLSILSKARLCKVPTLPHVALQPAAN